MALGRTFEDEIAPAPEAGELRLVEIVIVGDRPSKQHLQIRRAALVSIDITPPAALRDRLARSPGAAMRYERRAVRAPDRNVLNATF